MLGGGVESLSGQKNLMRNSNREHCLLCVGGALFFFMLLFTGGSSAFAQKAWEEHYLWRGELSNAEYAKLSRGQRRAKVIVYLPQQSKERAAAAAAVADNSAWCEENQKRAEKRTAVIVMPGGSYRYLAINSEGKDVARRLAANGYVAVMLRYSIGYYGGRYPEQLEDYAKCVEYLKAHSRELGIDTAKIGVMGFSAGGHLAGCTTASDILYSLPQSAKIQPSANAAFAAMIYPVVTMSKPYSHNPSRVNLCGSDTTLYRKLSLERVLAASKGDIPPIFLLHCQDDKVVDVRGTQDLAAVLATNKRNHIEIWPTGGHGFGAAPHKSSSAVGWLERFVGWLKENGFE